MKGDLPVALLLTGSIFGGAADLPEWQPTAPIQDADGRWHTDCSISVGDTSFVRCADGFSETS